MLAAIMVFPALVTGSIVEEKSLSNTEIMELLRMPQADSPADAEMPAIQEAAPVDSEELDPLKAMQESMENSPKTTP
jgi:hypothetical protein